MKHISAFVCRFLIALMIVFPFTANAGMIGTEAAVATTADHGNRDKVRDFMNRGNVVSQLQTLGVSGAAAQERVDSLTQEEVNTLAGKIDTLPAGAMADGWIVVLVALVIGGIIWGWWGPNRTSR